MPWQPKTTAPPTFNLADEFLALITGDPTWGWLVDWIPLIDNTNLDTALFCAAGPLIPPDLSVIFGPSPPDRNPLSALAKTATLVAGLGMLAMNRVFGAYCEDTPAPTDLGWSDYSCRGGTTSVDFQNFGIVPIPAGCTRLRIKMTAAAGNAGNGATFQSCTVPFSGGHFQGSWGGVVDQVFEIACPAPPANQGIYTEWRSAGTTVTECYSFLAPGLGSPEPYDPPPQAQPDGVISPLQTVAPTLEGIAGELMRHELKLDTLRLFLQSIAGATLDLGGPAGDPADLTPDTPVDVGDAVGCIITTSNIPASRTLDFGNPQNVVKLAHINFGTPAAWYPSIWLTHSPMIVRPFPPGTTRVTITGLPPGTTASIALISRNK